MCTLVTMSSHSTSDAMGALQQSLVSLETEGRELSDEMVELEHELEVKRERAARVQAAVQAIQAVLGNAIEPSPIRSAEEAAQQAAVDPLTNGEPPATNTAPPLQGAAMTRGRILRIRSTSEVQRIVNAAGGALTREEIHQAFMETVEIPDTWTNPPNAINNALLRAVNKGLIQELEDGRYTALSAT